MFCLVVMNEKTGSHDKAHARNVRPTALKIHRARSGCGDKKLVKHVGRNVGEEGERARHCHAF